MTDRDARSRGPRPMLGTDLYHPVERKHRGSHAELLACAWLLERGFEVFRNVSSFGPADVVGWKDGEFFLFDVKQSHLSMNSRAPRFTSAPRLTTLQERLGVRPLYVTPEGICTLDTSAFNVDMERRIYDSAAP